MAALWFLLPHAGSHVHRNAHTQNRKMEQRGLEALKKAVTGIWEDNSETFSTLGSRPPPFPPLPCSSSQDPQQRERMTA